MLDNAFVANDQTKFRQTHRNCLHNRCQLSEFSRTKITDMTGTHSVTLIAIVLLLLHTQTRKFHNFSKLEKQPDIT